MKKCGATAKDVLTTPIKTGFLRIPAVTLPVWIEVECHCHSLRFTATLLNEQDLLTATGQKSDHSGWTVHNLFDKHPDQLEHAIANGQLNFETVIMTHHHKRIHQKDLVTTGVSNFGAACTHPLIPPMPPPSHPVTTRNF